MEPEKNDNNVFAIIKDFTQDLCNTFPELNDKLSNGLSDILRDDFFK